MICVEANSDIMMSLARALKHLEHALGDEDAADDDAGHGNDGDGSEHSGKIGFMFARNQSACSPLRLWHRARWSATSRACARGARPCGSLQANETGEHGHVNSGEQIEFR